MLWTADGIYIGRRAIELAASALLQNYPEYDFTPIGEVDEIPNAARMRWSFGALGSRPALTGFDVIVLAKERITAMYRFLDEAQL